MDDRTLEITPVEEPVGKHKIVGERAKLEVLRAEIIERRKAKKRKSVSGHAQKLKAKRRTKNAAKRESRRRNR